MHAFSFHRGFGFAIALVVAGGALSSSAADKKPAAKAATKSAATNPAAAKPTAPKPAVKAEPDSDEAKHLLRYKFRRGETLRWEVEQRSQIRTSIQGTTQTAETVSTSVKVWKIADVDAKGQAKFTYSVEHVKMRQKFDGRQELEYDSDVDKEPPPGFEEVAKAVDVPLSVVTLDSQGKTVAREEKLQQAAPAPELITLPLPDEAVAVGGEWTKPFDVTATLRGGEVKKIKARQHYTLVSVSGDVATIRLETQIISPVRDNPEIEAQIAQSKVNGEIRFAIDEGRIVSQQTDVDERVNGFQGEASSMHCVTRFTEKLLPEGAVVNQPPVAGPPSRGAARPEDAPVISRRNTGKKASRK